jgi:hypothetical protein
VPPLSAEQASGLDLILEGFLLHHGRPRALRMPDGGRRVLAGDLCYAHGLVRVAESGDLFVIAALSDLIALGAGLAAREAEIGGASREALPDLWRATTAAIAARAPAGPRGAGGPSEVGARRFLAATRELRERGDATALAALAAVLPPTPGLAEALAG